MIDNSINDSGEAGPWGKEEGIGDVDPAMMSLFLCWIQVRRRNISPVEVWNPHAWEMRRRFSRELWGAMMTAKPGTDSRMNFGHPRKLATKGPRAASCPFSSVSPVLDP